MRHLLATAAAIGFVAIVPAPAGAAEDPHLLTPGALRTPDEPGAAPAILRGSAIDPKPSVATESDQRYQIAAGEELWFFDPVTLDIRSCINRQTSTVGVRIVRCTPGSLSGFRRTFCRAFQP
jgi:hypothetical protein